MKFRKKTDSSYLTSVHNKLSIDLSRFDFFSSLIHTKPKMNKGRGIYDELDISKAVESKLNDVTVTAIPMASKPKNSYHQNSAPSAAHYSSKNQANQQYLSYQQNQLIQSAIQMVQQQQQLQQRQQREQLQRDHIQREQLQREQLKREQQQQLQLEQLQREQMQREQQQHQIEQMQREQLQREQQKLLLSEFPSMQNTNLTIQSAGLSKYAQLLAVIEEMGRGEL